MSILDLQGMGPKEPNNSSGNSHGSHGCGNVTGGGEKNSGLSIACDIL